MPENRRFSVRPVPEDIPEHDVLRINQPYHTTTGVIETATSIPNLFESSSTTCLYPARRGSQLVHHTREALPRVDNYLNCITATKRPSIGELHGEDSAAKDVEEGLGTTPGGGVGGGHGIRLGWIQGVLIPCLLNIWGVMLFLRLSWVVGQAGIGQSLVIIAISAIVCVLTTLSMSAISTNGEVQGGGIYYIISRSLGPEFGASIGVVFAFANAVAASMNTIGFCNSLNDLLKTQGLSIVDGSDNDVRIVGVVAILIMVIICAVGMEWESKAQNFLVVIIVGAIVDFIIGACMGPNGDSTKIAQGFPGLSVDLLAENWGADYRFSENVNQSFFSVFAIFFPSVTGIQAGANISGDLKDAAEAIPKGTLLALLISMISYAVFVVFAGGSAVRDASGNIADVINGTYTNCIHNDCKYGLMNSYSAMQLISVWGPFIYAGCFAATLSTALTNLLSVPRLIQALGIDQIYPGLIFFSKGYGKSGEPYRGYVLTFLISSAFLLIAQLNVIAPLISNFYLASYALINFCTFHAALIKPLGWRPTFKFYNIWLSLAGFIICVAIMFLIDWVTSLVTFFIIFALYLIVVYRKPDVNWGSSTQAQTYKAALSQALKLSSISEHVKNYHPQILVLSGKPQCRPPLLQFANLITKNKALLMCGDISERGLSHRNRSSCYRNCTKWLEENKIKGFYSLVDGLGFEEGARALMQASGIGKMKPNIILLGYKNNWMSSSAKELTAYFNILHDGFDNRMAVTILRLPHGLDISQSVDDVEGLISMYASSGDLSGSNQLLHGDSNLSILPRNESDISLQFKGVSQFTVPDSPVNTKSYGMNNRAAFFSSPNLILKNKKKAVAEQILSKSPSSTVISSEVIDKLNFFERKQKKGTIDVWWLYDDGGLTILLPYIISTRHLWSACKLRIFALSNKKMELELEERNMASLLSKFRIEYSSLKMVTDVMEKPKEETVNFFNNLLESFKEGQSADPECVVSDIEILALQDKTSRNLRLRECLLENSKNANLVFMSLPMPRKGTVSAPLYMAWLEALTRDMPPFLLVRGNHSSVLTFYS